MRNTLALYFTLAFISWAACSRAQEVTTETVLNTTSLPKSQSSDIVTVKTVTSATSRTTTDDFELAIATSTADSIGVNSDDTVAATTVFNESDEDLPTNSSSSESEVLGGIEPKSINGAAPGSNSLSDSDETSAKIVDSSDDTVEKQASSSAPSDTPKKLHRLNMTQIDQMYLEGHKDEQEVVESWNKMGKKLKKGVGNLIGSMVPYALNMTQEAKISSNCSGAMLKWVLSMNQLKSWALRMLDASGKPIAGLLEGSLTMFGNYRQCLKIRAPDDDEIEFSGEFREYFRGKYCIIQAKPWLPEKSRFYTFNTKIKSLMESMDEESAYDKSLFNEVSEWALAFNFVNIRYDLCIPSMCSREDIQKVINFLINGIDLKARVLRCEMDSPDGSFSSSVESSQQWSHDNDMMAAASTNPDGAFLERKSNSYIYIGWLFVPVIVITLVLIATAISAVVGEKKKRMTKLNHTIKSLSLKRSLSSHLNVDYDQLADDKPLALYGVRFILVMWVILVESAVNLKYEYLRELLMLKDFIFWWPLQVIINSTLQFDSIILLTAFTMSYKNCLNEGVSNVKALTKFVMDKYIRLMPSVMVMVALVILLPLIYKGPVWNDYVTKQSAVCQSSGWLNMVLLQNYLPYQEICIPQTWLICIEFQLVLLMAPIVYFLNKHYTNNYGHAITGITSSSNKQALGDESVSRNRIDASRPFYWLKTGPGAILMACIGLGLGCSFYNVYTNELPPSWFYTMPDPDSKSAYFNEHLMRIWTHIAVFAFGILGGLECRRASKNVIRGYKGVNMDLHQSNFNNGLKHRSSSSSTIPVISQSDSLSSSYSSKSATNGSSNNLNNSSVTININASNNRSDESINRTDGRYARPRSWCKVLLDIISCLAAITIMLLIIFSTHDWSINDLPKPLIAGAFDAGSRCLWSIALLWLLYMVSVPNRDREFSMIAKALGHPAMVCLGKLSFLIYLIQPFVHMTVLAIQEQPIYSSWLMLFHIFVGNMTITVIIASLMSLFVEMPCRNLFRRCGTSLLLTPPPTNDTTPSATTANSTTSIN